MEYLAQNSLKGTIFAVGSRVLYNPRLLQAQYLAGHQIGVHTWCVHARGRRRSSDSDADRPRARRAHPHLTNMTTPQVVAELGWSRQIIRDVLGVTPNFMRPPYGDIECVPRRAPRAPRAC
jgi:peptidoglycan/xylan/chitin deacetylase (PgdA/CDA1 family)